MVLQPYPNPVVSDTAHKSSLFGRLLAAAHTLGLHLDPRDWAIPPWQISLRRRLSFTIYSTDKWLAASLGRPQLLRADDWLVVSLTPLDTPSAAFPTSLWSEQLRYSALCSILTDVLTELYSLRAVYGIAWNEREMLEKARPLLERLLSWQRDRFAHASDRPECRQLRDLCDLGHHFIKLLIFKAASRSLLHEHDDRNSDLDADARPEARHFSRSGSQGATSAAAEYIGSLNQEHCDMFWPHWTQSAFASVCFVQLTMALSSTSRDEAISWFRELADLRKKMRVRSRAMPILRLGLLRMDSIFWKGPKTVLTMTEPVLQAFHAVFVNQDDPTGT